MREVLPALVTWWRGEAMLLAPGAEPGDAGASAIDQALSGEALDPAGVERRGKAIAWHLRDAAAVLATPRSPRPVRLYRFVRVAHWDLPSAGSASLPGIVWRSGHLDVQSWTSTLEGARAFAAAQYGRRISRGGYQGVVVAARVPGDRVLFSLDEVVTALLALARCWREDGHAAWGRAALDTATFLGGYVWQREVVVDLPGGEVRVAAVYPADV